MKYLLLACGFLGLGLAFNGTMFLIAPAVGRELFGLPDGDDGLCRLLGVRQVAFGLVATALAVLREVRALGVFFLAGAVVPVADGWLVWERTGPLAAMRHLGAIPICLGVAFLLLRRRPPL